MKIPLEGSGAPWLGRVDRNRFFMLLVALVACCLAVASMTGCAASPPPAPVELWNLTLGTAYGDAGWSIAGCSDGGYIIAGQTIRGSGSDLWVIKTDRDGSVLWDKVMGGDGDDMAASVQQTADGGYIVAGTTRSFSSGGERVWLIKLDEAGGLQWDRTFGGFISSSGDGGWSVEQTDDLGYIVAGYTRSFGDGGRDMWLLKVDSEGDIQWQRAFGGKGDDVGYSAVQMPDGGYMVAGYTRSMGAGGQEVYLVRTNGMGQEIWNRTFGDKLDEAALCMILSTDGSVVLTGRKDSSSIINPEKITTRVLFMKVDQNGSLIMKTEPFCSVGATSEVGMSIIQTNDGGFLITGRTGQQRSEQADKSGKDLMLIKLDSRGFQKWCAIYGGRLDDTGAASAMADDGYLVLGTTGSYGAGEEDIWLLRLSSAQPEVGSISENANATTHQLIAGSARMIDGANRTAERGSANASSERPSDERCLLVSMPEPLGNTSANGFWSSLNASKQKGFDPSLVRTSGPGMGMAVEPKGLEFPVRRPWDRIYPVSFETMMKEIERAGGGPTDGPSD